MPFWTIWKILGLCCVAGQIATITAAFALQSVVPVIIGSMFCFAMPILAFMDMRPRG